MFLTLQDPKAISAGNKGKIIYTWILFALALPLAIFGTVGLVSTILFILLYTGAWMLRPKVYHWAANKRLKLLKEEAAKNPIETLENQLRLREEALARFRDEIKSLFAELNSFKAMVEEHKKEYVGDTKYDADLNKMTLLLRYKGTKYQEALTKLQAFARDINRKRSEWNIAQQAHRMQKAAAVGTDFLDRVMTDAAYTSIQTSLNVAFAELEVSALDIPLEKLESFSAQRSSEPVRVQPEPIADRALSSPEAKLSLDFDPATLTAKA